MPYVLRQDFPQSSRSRPNLVSKRPCRACLDLSWGFDVLPERARRYTAQASPLSRQTIQRSLPPTRIERMFPSYATAPDGQISGRYANGVSERAPRFPRWWTYARPDSMRGVAGGGEGCLCDSRGQVADVAGMGMPRRVRAIVFAGE